MYNLYKPEIKSTNLKALKPPEIEAALSALETLSPELSGDDLASLKKALPALARQMAQAGEDVNEAILINHVRQGEEHLAVLKDKYSQKPKTEVLTYEGVVKGLPEANPYENNYFDIFTALHLNDFEHIKELLPIDDDLTYQAMLCKAVESENLKAIKWLRNEYEELFDKCNLNEPIAHACGFGFLEIAKFLVENNTRFQIRAFHPFHAALRKENQDVLEFLIICGKYDGHYSLNAELRNASSRGFSNIVELLIEKGADVRTDCDDPIELALANGHWDIVYLLQGHGADIAASEKKLIQGVAKSGGEKEIKILYDAFPDVDLVDLFAQSIKHGNLDVIRYCLDEGVDYQDFDYEYGGVSFKNKDALSVAAKYVQKEVILFFKKYDPNFYNDHLTNALKASGQYDLDGKIDADLVYFLVNEGAEVEKIKSHTKYFVQNGDVELVKFLIDNGADVCVNDNEALTVACRTGNLPMVKLLVENGANELISAKPRPEDDGIKWGENLQILDYLTEHISFDLKEHTSHEGILEYRLGLLENYRTWKRMFPDMEIGNKLGLYNPHHFSKDAYQAVLPMLKVEGYDEDAARRYAYEASCLFKSEQRVLQYLEKWGEAGRQPLHDIILHIHIPRKGRPDLKVWGDAVLKHGPKMAKFVKFADRLTQPMKDGSGGWSYTKTKEEIAKHAYRRGHENPRLATFCLEHAWDDDDFEDALKQIKKFKKKYKPSDLPEAANNNIKGGAIPDIIIDGTKFGKDGHTFRKLPDGDVRGLLLGEFTNCCQHLANAGRDCAKHGFLSENGGFYVVEDDKTGDIIGQTWAWRGKKGELVFDSLESLSGHFNAEKWSSLCRAFSEKIKTIAQEAGITALHVGTGGATPNGMSFSKAEKAAKPIDYKGYRDSSEQYQFARF